MSAQNDCPEAIIVCGNSGYMGLTATGAGIQEVLGTNDCTSREHHSIWLELHIKTGGTLGFVLTPESNELEVDYDFFIYGPNVQCDSIGHTIRCSTTNPLLAGSASNITGMDETQTDIAEGPGEDGDNFINWMTVQDGEMYFLVVDRPVGDSNFSIQWTGTATFHEVPEFRNPNNIPVDLQQCDDDGIEDQQAVFDLTEHLAMFIGNQANVVLSYHESLNDATINAGLITNMGSYLNTSNPQTIYMRMTNTVTGCFSTESFDLTVHPLPVFNNPQNISLNLEACDTDGNDNGTFIFDLTKHKTLLLDTQADVQLTYHTTLNGAQTGSATINNPTTFVNTSNPQTIYMRMVNSVTGCVSTSSFDIVANHLPPFHNPQNISLTLEECSADGQTAVFNLAKHAAMLTNGQQEMELTYYDNLNDAIGGINAIASPEAYQNTSNPQQVFMRMTNIATGCSSTGMFEIKVFPLPVFNNPAGILLSLEECDNDGIDDISAAFNLTQHAAMLKGNQANVVLSWHESFNNAMSNSNAITNVTAYHNIANPQTIYMRMTNTVTGCFVTDSFELKIKDKPIFNNPMSISLNLAACDTDGADDAFFVFDLTAHAEMLKGGAPDVVLTWHEDFNDAVAGSSAIINPGTYENLTNPQTIYMRLESTATGCINLKPFEIRVNPLPVFNNPTGTPLVIEECDLPGAGQHATFNLTQHESLLKGSQQQMAISYYQSQADAAAGINAIPDAVDYTNAVNPQTIYMRMLNTVTGCVSTGSLSIKVNDMPVFNNPQDISIILEECDTDGSDDGMMNFDLAQHATMLIGAQAGMAITYYTSLNDAIAGANAIPDAGSYTNTSNPQDIYMRMTNTATGCFNNAMFSIWVHSLPYFDNPQGISLKLEECDADTIDDKSYIFDLTTHENMLRGGQPYIDYSYHEDPADAETGANAIINPAAYRNKSNPQTVYVRMYNTATGCYSTGSFEIEVVEILDAGEPEDIEMCDYNGNGYQVFNLAENDAALKNGNIDTYVRYYRTESDAKNEVNPLPLLYQNRAPYQPEIIWARLENVGGCFGFDIKSFSLVIIPLRDIAFSVKVADFTDHDNTLIIIMNDTQGHEFSLDGATFIDDNTFTNLDPGLYTLYVRTKDRCNLVRKEVAVMQYPKFFTPNGDGVHENWTVPYLYMQPKATITIFDRYGKTITRFKGDSKGWDGQYNGAALPSTDYWFMLELEDGRIIKSHFSMLR